VENGKNKNMNNINNNGPVFSGATQQGGEWRKRTFIQRVMGITMGSTGRTLKSLTKS